MCRLNPLCNCSVKGLSLNNRFDMPVRNLLVRRIADTQHAPIWIGYSGLDPHTGLGEAWHAAGMKHQKQTVFDDFIAAAEWLIANGQTSREKLSIFR